MPRVRIFIVISVVAPYHIKAFESAGTMLAICPILIQSFHPGSGVGQEFLMDRGELVAVFQHQRLHERVASLRLPGGGSSSYRRTMPVDQALLRHSLNMLRDLCWTGVAMVVITRP
jgi:hypothetical protein